MTDFVISRNIVLPQKQIDTLYCDKFGDLFLADAQITSNGFFQCKGSTLFWRPAYTSSQMFCSCCWVSKYGVTFIFYPLMTPVLWIAPHQNSVLQILRLTVCDRSLACLFMWCSTYTAHVFLLIMIHSQKPVVKLAYCTDLMSSLSDSSDLLAECRWHKNTGFMKGLNKSILTLSLRRPVMEYPYRPLYAWTWHLFWQFINATEFLQQNTEIQMKETITPLHVIFTFWLFKALNK